MATECPVCHRPIPFWRVIRTTAWGSWKCPDCDSKLGVDRKRRFLALIPWIVVVLLVMVFTPIMQYSMFLTIGLLTCFFLVNFYFFERATVLERAGFRCRECGYDLQGQVQPLCPECGYELSGEEHAVLERIRSGEVVSADQMRQLISKRWGMGGIIIVIIIALALAGTLGGMLVLYRANRMNVMRSGSPETQLLADAVRKAALRGNGPVNRHILGPALEFSLTTDQFVISGSLTDRSRIVLGAVTLEDLDGMTVVTQRELAATLDATLPADTIVHRLGDFVFTYHGIDLPTSESANSLWLVVGVPDPDQNPLTATEKMQLSIPVGLADGSVQVLSGAGFSASLAAQNSLRQSLGLPDLPDPFIVKHDQPAVGGERD